MTNFDKRVSTLEQRYKPRNPGLSSTERKRLTDLAVRNGDEAALAILSLHRPIIIHASPEQRAAAVAAGLRAHL